MKRWSACSQKWVNLFQFFHSCHVQNVIFCTFFFFFGWYFYLNIKTVLLSLWYVPSVWGPECVSVWGWQTSVNFRWEWHGVQSKLRSFQWFCKKYGECRSQVTWPQVQWLSHPHQKNPTHGTPKNPHSCLLRSVYVLLHLELFRIQYCWASQARLWDNLLKWFSWQCETEPV